jgi:hypothetical protein
LPAAVVVFFTFIVLFFVCFPSFAHMEPLTFFFKSFFRREHSIFQDGGAPSDGKPLEGILSFGKGIKEADPFEHGGSYDDED